MRGERSLMFDANRHGSQRGLRGLLFLLFVGAVALPGGTAVAAAPATQPAVVCRVTGLFDAEREADLRTLAESIPGVKLLSVDLDRAQATFAVNAAQAFPDTKGDKLPERLDQVIRKASFGTFAVSLPRPPAEKPARVEIAIPLLDCRACALGVHDMLMRVDGVQQVVVDLKNQKAFVHIDAAKTSEADLLKLLKSREVIK